MLNYEPTISVCMIAKNEEIILPKTLSSICKFVDEIIFVDTGSIDKTKEIAKRYTTKIYDFEWIDDFSAAKNFAISKATKEWVLVLDADEIVKDPQNLKKNIINNPEVQAFYFNHINILADYTLITDVNYMTKIFKHKIESDIIRLFKKEYKGFYKGFVHETLYFEKRPHATKKNLAICNVRNKDKVKLKDELYFKLNLKNVEANISNDLHKTCILGYYAEKKDWNNFNEFLTKNELRYFKGNKIFDDILLYLEKMDRQTELKKLRDIKRLVSA